jgi:hypothetical protein
MICQVQFSPGSQKPSFGRVVVVVEVVVVVVVLVVVVVVTQLPAPSHSVPPLSVQDEPPVVNVQSALQHVTG